MMSRRYVVALILAGFLAGACRSGKPDSFCPGPTLSREQIIDLVHQELVRRGQQPADDDTKSLIEIRREDCDYLYHEEGIPKRPGDFLFVRLSPAGEILTFLPGS